MKNLKSIKYLMEYFYFFVGANNNFPIAGLLNAKSVCLKIEIGMAKKYL
jgi:hypothetical protein